MANRPIKPKIRGFLAFRAYVPLYVPLFALTTMSIYGSRDTRSLYPRAHGYRDHDEPVPTGPRLPPPQEDSKIHKCDVAVAPAKEFGKGINPTNQDRIPFDRDLVEFDELK